MDAPRQMLKSAMARKQWSQAELARRSGLTPVRVSRLLSGDVSITPRSAIALEDAGLGFPAEDWMAWESRHKINVLRKGME